MAERTYEVPICDLKSSKRNKIFYVRVNQYGEGLVMSSEILFRKIRVLG